MKRFYIPVALSLATAACASSSGYPSLLPRANEGAGFAEPAESPPATAAPDPALDARIAAAQRDAAAAGARFDTAARTAEDAVGRARSARAGSDRWLDAQTAIADLDVLRAETVERLADLERLAADRAATLATDYPPLDTAIAAARGNADDQARRIAALQALLAPA